MKAKTKKIEEQFRAKLSRIKGREVKVAPNVRLTRSGGYWALECRVGDKVKTWPVPGLFARQFIKSEIDWLGRQWLTPRKERRSRVNDASTGRLLDHETVCRITDEVLSTAAQS